VNFGAHEEIQLLGLLVALGALLALAPALRLPVPVLLVAGGVALGFVPGLPQLVLPPDIVLVALLPPLLYSAAFFTSLRDLRSNLRPISLLAVGLVGMTMTGVAAVAHGWLGLAWAPAFALGAIVSPTDALAVTEIAGRVGLPRRIIAILEGESLVNDGTALVLYKAAVGAAVGGSFSLLHVGVHLVLNIAGGIAIGLGVGFLIRQVRKRTDDPPIEVAIALLTGYVAYLPASAAGVSGVLAAVTAGVYMGWYTPELTTAQTRLSGDAFWEILTFVLNALLFALVGLQLRHIVHSLSGSRNYLDRDSAGVGADIHLCAALPVQERPGARSLPAVAGARRDCVVRHPRRHLARRSTGAAHRLPRSRPDHLRHLLRACRHARRPGSDTAGADSAGSPPGGRRRRRS
jgi:Na+/H+ antiporter